MTTDRLVSVARRASEVIFTEIHGERAPMYALRLAERTRCIYVMDTDDLSMIWAWGPPGDQTILNRRRTERRSSRAA